MKKISIIVPCYGTEQYVEKCINSLLNQTYKNLEIIVVNDCSKGNMQEILDKISAKDDRIKVITNEVNKGLLHTRIIGSKEATGDYVAFVDSDDYVDLDFYRLLINNAEENKSDIVISNYARNEKGIKHINGLQNNSNNVVYEGKEFYKRYFKQTGRIIRYHVIWDKLIKKSVWDKVLDEVTKIKDRVVMTEDFAFSSIALYYAKKVSFCDEAVYFYSINDNQSTSTTNLKVSRINKNIKDITTSFEFVKNFLERNNSYDEYKEYLEKWKNAYIYIHVTNYIDLKKKNKKIEQITFDYENDEEYRKYFQEIHHDESRDNYFGLITTYNENLSEIKRIIMSEDTEIVSFDMFDTLVVRPFLVPSDMFTLLNKTFHKEFNVLNVIDFGKIRKDAEQELRNLKNNEGICEVTLEGIYDHISESYGFDRKKLSIIEKEEINMEIHFCYRRNTGYELYRLAKELGKKVILVSDIYLSKDTLLKILEKNGYTFDEYYVSSELLKTKSNGNLFDYVKEQEGTDKIFHLGDNYHSDFLSPKDHGVNAYQLPKATDTMMGYTGNIVKNCGNLYKHFELFNIDHIPYEQNFGVRCSIAIAGNYYFDNPFRPFNEYSDFNGDPYFIGFYALGMQTISMCKWLFEDLRDNNIDSVSFMARDGYLPYEAAKIFKEKTSYKKDVKLNYTYVSRKSLMPLVFKDKSGTSLIDTYLNYDMVSPKDIIKQLNKVVTSNKEFEEKLDKEFPLDKKFTTREEFNKCVSMIYDNCFDKKKYDNYYKMCKEYFGDQFSGNASTFDIGYSGKPEAILTSVVNKPITTYFVHTNSSEGYKNSMIGNFKLKTFFDFKPTLTGTVRELFISYVGPSCIGYDYKDNKVVPVFGSNKNYNFFNIDMIEKIQKGALDFVDEFCNHFSDYMEYIDLNKYYMSVPMEYYYHYATMEDRLPYKNLLFDDNVNNMVELNDFIFNLYNNYAREYNQGMMPNKFTNATNYNLPKSRVRRIIHYSLHDRPQLKHKWNVWKRKKDNPEELPSNIVKRIAYYAVFDREKIKEKICKKK